LDTEVKDLFQKYKDGKGPGEIKKMMAESEIHSTVWMDISIGDEPA